MWFMATNKTKEQLLDCKGEQTLEVIGTMNINEFRGTVTHQIIVEDFEVHDKSFDDLFWGYKYGKYIWCFIFNIFDIKIM